MQTVFRVLISSALRGDSEVAAQPSPSQRVGDPVQGARPSCCVARQEAEREAGRSVTFAIEEKVEGRLCGVVNVRDIDREHSQGELSFWLAINEWGQGYMSEVIPVIVRYGFEVLRLNRLYAYHMLRNPTTGRVLEKNGFKQEGLLRQRVQKWDQFEDVLLLAILRQDWQAS